MAETALVLTYHSISDAPGPTNIAPETFAMQMEMLGRCGYTSARLDEFLAWHEGRGDMARKVLITFDDAFADFAETAVPILASHGLTALMFVPTRKLGGVEDWYTAPPTNRPLMSRDQVVALSAQGMEFGAHGRTHVPLPSVTGDERTYEIVGSKIDIAELLGTSPSSFAAPYGAVNADVIREIGDHYALAFGTRFAEARRSDPRHDIPRIDMHYFRVEPAWRNFLEGGRLYFRARQALRMVGQAVRR